MYYRPSFMGMIDIDKDEIRVLDTISTEKLVKILATHKKD
jgi:hypothetical protein